MELEKIQSYLTENDLDGWLMADFHGRNDIAVKMLNLTGLLTRRFFYFIPSRGNPTAIVHNVEKQQFLDIPGEMVVYSGYKELEEKLGKLLKSGQKIAMEYSHMGRLPYIGLVEAGTIELIRSFGLEIVSSADLVAFFLARLTPEQIAMHRIAAGNLLEIKNRAFDFITNSIKNSQPITELDVVGFILDEFEQRDMETDHAPICAIDANAGNPHYEPADGNAAEIKKGQLVLIDLWAKSKHPDGTVADITWMAYSGTKEEIPKKYVEIFEILARARDAAVSFLRTNVDTRAVTGAEVDDVCRQVVIDAGYGEFFTHRTGHSITSATHGPGPNIDNLETEDSRILCQGHLHSIEPGIYLPDCGFRTEIDVLFGHEGTEVTTLPVQKEIEPLF